MIYQDNGDAIVILLSALFLNFACLEVELFLCHVLRKCEVCHLSCGTDGAVVYYFGFNEDEVAFLVLYSASYLNGNLLFAGNRFLVFDIEVCGHSRCLELAAYNPAPNLVEQRGLYAAVQGVKPSLKVYVGSPERNDILAVFVEFHLQSVWVARCTGETVITFIGKFNPGVDNLFHIPFAKFGTNIHFYSLVKYSVAHF